MIPDKTIPFVFMHFEMNEQMYDLKLMADMRKFFFKPDTERQVYEKMRSHFLGEFNRLCPKCSLANTSNLEELKFEEGDDNVAFSDIYGGGNASSDEDTKNRPGNKNGQKIPQKALS